MQYSITINQFAVMNAGLDLDVVDMAIFDFIKHYSHSDKCMKLQTENGTYFWISHNTIIQQLPILGISTGAGIVKRINKLIDSGLLARHPNCDLMRKTFYKFGPNYDKINFATPNESLQPTTNVVASPNESLGITPNESCRYHNTKNNHNTIYQEENANALFPPATIEAITPEGEKERKVAQKERKTAEPLCLFENSRYNDIELFKASFDGPEFADVDLDYYFHSVADWSSSKGAKKRDWIATARNFMRGDMEKGKLHRKPQMGIEGMMDPDEIAYLKMGWDGFGK